MASVKKIPLVDVKNFDKTKIFDYIKEKYTFIPINQYVIESAVLELSMLGNFVGTTDESFDQLEKSKEFLSDLISKYSFYVQNDS